MKFQKKLKTLSVNKSSLSPAIIHIIIKFPSIIHKRLPIMEYGHLNEVNQDNKSSVRRKT
jgi:hypothetical protein